jgi:hypothetical protein
MRTLNMLGEVDTAMEEVRGYGLENEEHSALPQPQRWKQ